MLNNSVAVFDPSTGRKSNAALTNLALFAVVPVNTGCLSLDLNMREGGGCELNPDSGFEAAADDDVVMADGFGCQNGIQEE